MESKDRGGLGISALISLLECRVTEDLNPPRTRTPVQIR